MDTTVLLLLPKLVEGPETVTRGGVNGSLKFLAKYLAVVPKLPPNTSGLAKLKYPSQLVTRVLRSILWNGTIPMQQTKSDLELR